MNEILDTAQSQISAPDTLIEIAIGMVGLIVVIFVHGIGIRLVNRRFSKSWIMVTAATPLWRVNLTLALTIAGLSLVHLTETLIWAVPISQGGIVASLRDSYYFVLESYTTLGASKVTIPDAWRLLGPIIAMSGLFTFGWTTSVLVSIMTEVGKLDRAQARQSKSSDGSPEA